MTDSVYAPPKADMTIQSSDSTEAYYVVSLTKMMVLFLATMGAYQVYWHYKNWRRHQQESLRQGGSDGDIWPIPRAIFSIFFIHSLLAKVKQHAIAQQRPTDFNTTLTATLIIVLVLFGVIGLFFSDPKMIVLLSVLQLVMIVPLMFVYRKAQRFINESCGDPNGETNASFTTANYVWIILGALMWLSQISALAFLATTL